MHRHACQCVGERSQRVALCRIFPTLRLKRPVLVIAGRCMTSARRASSGIAHFAAASHGTCPAGGRSEHGVSGRSRKSIGAIHHREFVPRDPEDTNQYIGACRDGSRSSQPVLAVAASGDERRAISRRAERPPDGRVTCDRPRGLKPPLYFGTLAFPFSISTSPTLLPAGSLKTASTTRPGTSNRGNRIVPPRSFTLASVAVMSSTPT